MEWGFDIGGGMSVRGLIGADGSTGSEEGRRAPRSFQPRVIDRREKEGRTRGEFFHRSGLESVDRGVIRARLLRRRRHRGDPPARGGGGRVGAARGVRSRVAGRGASRASGGFGAHLASADVRGGLRVASASHGDARRRLDGARGGRFSSGARSRSFRSREGGARGRSGGRDSGGASTIGARRARGPTRRCPRGGEGRRRARRCERGERGARATRPGGRSGSIDPRASIPVSIKQISSGVD